MESLSDLVEDGTVSVNALKEILGKAMPHYDKSGEAFYDIISALHKSVRGSDPDAALYWLCRMLVGGCDPLYILLGVWYALPQKILAMPTRVL